MCSGSEAGSYVRLVDVVYQSTLGLTVTKKKEDLGYAPLHSSGSREQRLGDNLVSKQRSVSPTVGRKVNIRLPGKGNSDSHGARSVHRIITMITWIRTSRLSIKNSLFRRYTPLYCASEGGHDVIVQMLLDEASPTVSKAHRLLYHSTLGVRVIKKKREQAQHPGQSALNPPPSTLNPEP